jgi:Flp pilus assembly protein CpaB
MKKKRILILALELVLLIAVMGGVFVYTQNQMNPTKIFEFDAPLNKGEIIKASHLKVSEIPGSALNESFIRSKDDVLGKIVTTNVSPGQYVTKDLVIEKDDFNPLELMDLSKMRKISFPITLEYAAAGDIKQGDIVDLVYTGVDQNEETGEEFIYSKIFMEDVIVWSMKTTEGIEYYNASNSDSFATTEEDELANIEGGNGAELAMVAVVVTGPQAEEIATRTTYGKIDLLSQFKQAETVDSVGYAIGEYQEVKAGNVDPEKLKIEETEIETENN